MSVTRVLLTFIVVAFVLLGAAQIAAGSVRLGIASMLLGAVNWLLLSA